MKRLIIQLSSRIFSAEGPSGFLRLAGHYSRQKNGDNLFFNFVIVLNFNHYICYCDCFWINFQYFYFLIMLIKLNLIMVILALFVHFCANISCARAAWARACECARTHLEDRTFIDRMACKVDASDLMPGMSAR